MERHIGYGKSMLKSDIYEFENKVEEIRDALMEGHLVFSKDDVNVLKQVVEKLDIFHLLAVVRLLGPILEIEQLSQDAASIIITLLQHPKDEVTYAVIEAISYGLGEVAIAEELLAEAKDLLKNDKSIFVREYLESL